MVTNPRRLWRDRNLDRVRKTFYVDRTLLADPTAHRIFVREVVDSIPVAPRWAVEDAVWRLRNALRWVTLRAPLPRPYEVVTSAYVAQNFDLVNPDLVGVIIERWRIRG